MGKRFTKSFIVERFKEIHGDKYDYSLVEYLGDSKKIKIGCPIHGIFLQAPAEHYRQKQGCSKCAHATSQIPRRIKKENLIQNIEAIYGTGVFDFSNVEYLHAHKPINLKCIKHNNCFRATWNDLKRHIHKCSECSKETNREKFIKKWFPVFLENTKKVHGNIYDYSKTVYKNNYEKIEIICLKHGSFFQKPSDHIHGKNGCPVCQTSHGEELVGLALNERKINFNFQYPVKINRSWHYYDFYLPKQNIIIEFNGLQHYKPIKFFDRNGGFENLQKRDKEKAKYCSDNDIKLVIIKYDEVNQIDKILDSFL